MSICTSSERNFTVLRDIAATSMAFPSSFALPVDANDDAEFLTIAFRVGNNVDAVVVLADERTATVRDTMGAARVCRLPCAVDPSSLRQTFAAPHLNVALRKKRAAFELPPCSDGSSAESCSTVT